MVLTWFMWIYSHRYRTSHSTRGSVPPGTSGAAGFLLHGNLYIFAGHTEHSNSNTLYRLDLSNLTWTILVPGRDPKQEPDADSGQGSEKGKVKLNVGPMVVDDKLMPSPRDKFSSWVYENKWVVALDSFIRLLARFGIRERGDWWVRIKCVSWNCVYNFECITFISHGSKSKYQLEIQPNYIILESILF